MTELWLRRFIEDASIAPGASGRREALRSLGDMLMQHGVEAARDGRLGGGRGSRELDFPITEEADEVERTAGPDEADEPGRLVPVSGARDERRQPRS